MRVSTAPDIQIRQVERSDVATLFGLIAELAEYEKLTDSLVGDPRVLEETLFERDAADALIVEADGEAVGYAIYFTTFSSFECRPGLWLEDVYVRPALRGHGIGRELMALVAEVAVERGCARLEWVALDWNETAIGFYEKLGAVVIEGWQAMRLEGEQLRRLGAGADDPPP